MFGKNDISFIKFRQCGNNNSINKDKHKNNRNNDDNKFNNCQSSNDSVSFSTKEEGNDCSGRNWNDGNLKELSKLLKEEGCGNRGDATTCALGEEGGERPTLNPRPTIKPMPTSEPLPTTEPTILPTGEPEYTTMALGEEGGEMPTITPTEDTVVAEPTTEPTIDTSCDDDPYKDILEEEENPFLP